MSKTVLTFILACVAIAFAPSLYGQSKAVAAPRVFLMDGQKLRDIKQGMAGKEKTFLAAVDKIEAEARKALKEETYSVTSKAVTPPSGDKHDYMSQAPY